MRTLRGFLDTLPTAATVLRGIRRGDRFHSLAGPCCRAREDGQEVAPSGVLDAFVESGLAAGPVVPVAPGAIRLRCWAAAQVGGLDRLHVDGIVPLHEGERRLVVEVGALPADVLVVLGALRAAFFRRLLPFLRRDTRRCAFCSARSALRWWRGFSTASPSAVMRNTLSPTSMPVSWPVRGSGRAGTSAHEQQTYQPSASLETVTVLMVPSIGRLHRTAMRPIFARPDGRYPAGRRCRTPCR